MKKIALTKDDRFLIFYFRYSLIFGVISAIALFFIVYFELNITNALGIVVVLLFLSSIPGYLILPGLLYEDFKTGMVFTVDQMIYYCFTILTLGIGPAVIYFYKYDPVLRKISDGR